MEKYEELRDMARKKIQIADHMLTMTYPMIKDPKLLLAVMENIFLALTNSIAASLLNEIKALTNTRERARRLTDFIRTYGQTPSASDAKAAQAG